MARIVITGGCGFLGQRLALALLAKQRLNLPDGSTIPTNDIILADRPGSTVEPGLEGKVSVTPVEITDPAAVTALIGPETAVIYHLAAVVSGQAEAEFDLGLTVNFDGTRNVLEAARALPHPVPVIGTSSLAVFGGALPEMLTEATATHPGNSYGMAKAMSEMLMSDYRRKGFAEARTLRLPTIIVRPGAPNAAASSFASGIFREPLMDKPSVCPVSPDLRMWLASPETAIAALIRAAEVPAADWPDFSAVNVPGITASVAQMLEALEAVGGAEARARVSMDPDPKIEAIVGTWPSAFDMALANGLGFMGDKSVREIVQRFKDGLA
ncbi:MAG: D-erythronate dehydrogenase [Pseudomonadota bacterium]